ncbi:hypothetical protein COV24_02470 [candidate division WWE3 bacterium CG10_big_fil_rev_8_21_14_0_10_32_10]|uniref:Mur ligase central domain-containing protein n=1 Tax=candidate division WWE3 bacterium CG10_big_fil_rev_8_21_14_0_10_32_10 TaxID=1975090 RepID=A0A2H0RAI3_UNCKA|nr:MAG: hypothetical protein COV24_02470 [candidate division WWE3 bacterium CG10_big_fil_rev_8_21_14_0_10_32_10]
MKIILYIISYFFIFIKILKVNLLQWGDGDTFAGYILEKTQIDFLSLFFKSVNSNYIFVTGTNGKTSTVSLINHILKSQNYSVLSNSTGSNLKRGILSAFINNLPKFYSKNPDFCVLEVDEASVPLILKSFPKNKIFSLMVLNLSRDQLDRYGEIDTLVVEINKSLKFFKNYNLILNKGPFFKHFVANPILVKKHILNNNLQNILKIKQYSHLSTNLDFILTLFDILNIKINLSSLSEFSFVAGRGSLYKKNNVSYEIHLTKNPVSFDNNLLYLSGKEYENILIFVNDNIPDGRDVSWFYDINYSYLKKILKNKSVYLAGTRSYDFYNFLNILNIESFNLFNLDNSFDFFKKTGAKKIFVLSNYSATMEIVKCLK